MRVSVVICTYAEDMYEHFCEAANSILNQTYENVELVVVVDGIQEVYDRVEADYGNRDDVIVSCNDENLGLLASRNRGAELATGDVVAFIDDDAIADKNWIECLVRAYEEENAIAAGGKMVPEWIADKPAYLPEEFYWLIGVTHKGFADRPSEVRNTFGSNISFRTDVFEELDGFDLNIGGRKGDVNLQGGETEVCARMRSQYGQGVWYDPEAIVAHKVFDYRTEFRWLLDRAFWQGYSKRAMETMIDDEGGEEGEFLTRLLTEFMPSRLFHILRSPSIIQLMQLFGLCVFTITVGLGYLYGFTRTR